MKYILTAIFLLVSATSFASFTVKEFEFHFGIERAGRYLILVEKLEKTIDMEQRKILESQLWVEAKTLDEFCDAQIQCYSIPPTTYNKVGLKIFTDLKSQIAETYTRETGKVLD